MGQQKSQQLGFGSRKLAMIGIFAALGIICDALITPGFSAGVWFGVIFLISPIIGIVLGPYAGFMSTFIAVMIGHWLVPRESSYEFIFTLGAPVGSMIAGFMFRGNWKRVIAFFTLLLIGYFIAPISRLLPIWGMWDVFAAYVILLIAGIIMSFRGSEDIKRLSPFALSAFISLEADVLLRIFVFVPLQTYQSFYGLTPEVLVALWSVPAPIITPFKVLLSTFVATLLAPQILHIMEAVRT